MSVHHVALATADLAATHRFYTQVMGFRLVKVLTTPYEGSRDGGWARHAFYETSEPGGSLLAFWDLHEEALRGRFRTDLSTALGLPVWVNHVAFTAPTEAFYKEMLARWLAHGLTVTEVDHDFCRSIYTMDPNGIMIELCQTLRSFTAEELADAERLLLDPAPAIEAPPAVVIHRPEARR
ncbi:glyoxalase [Sorangium cellulosum]|uniref:Glyoxalase n=1 Tax=Sorangium cellulosum TaxID=56 RepID=A0A4P2Q0E2_SORCE|nr:VOC family protein [Sorangium cellulosum]AUX22263.1 glyoxalase [Sorangium cellulosum]